MSPPRPAVSASAARAANPGNNRLLEVRDLKTHFFTDRGVAQAVDGVSLTIPPRRTLGLVGESGCGKSVTALSILRLVPSPPARIVAGRIVFNGDNYTAEWHDEAERRGLSNFKTTLDALEHMLDAKNRKLFSRFEVLSERELESRHEIALDQYFKTVNIEAETTAFMARTMILPAAIRYLNELATTVERGKIIGTDLVGVRETLKEVNQLVAELRYALDELNKQNADLGGDTVHEKAYHMRDKVIPAMRAVRDVADKLENVVAEDLWPVPTYRDMLFVK